MEHKQKRGDFPANEVRKEPESEHRREMKQDVDNRSLQQTRHYLAPARSLLASQKYSSSNSQAVKHYLSPARSSGNLKAIKHYLSPARLSTSSHTASQPLGSFARMIFRTERTETQQLHQCRASELTTRNPSSSPLAYVKGQSDPNGHRLQYIL